jgi:cellulose synthase/poly-beta-1,6-N-acetylglucosamine synthase-like glycosyltransferase
MSETNQWTNQQNYLPFYLGFSRWTLYILLKLVPCIFYKQITYKMICNQKNNEKTKNLFEEIEYTLNDVTVVCPVYQPPICFKENIISIAKNMPYEILIIADQTCYIDILHQVDGIEGNIHVINETKVGKREALVTGLKKVRTKLCCFVDDDVQWCPLLLYNLILPFNYKKIGGVGPKQIMRAKIPNKTPNLFEIMADFRLSVRYIENKAMLVVDAGTSCISGRTMCYKTNIIKNTDFYEKFLNEYFFKSHLLSGDDKFITRYILNNKYDTYHQLNNNCCLTTTFESGIKSFKQSFRWQKNTYRSDITLLFIERKIWKLHLFTALLLFDKLFTPIYMLYGLFIIPIISILRFDYVIVIGWIIWLLFSRGMKLIHHFNRKPEDLIYLPIYIAYQYLLILIRIYALFHLSNSSWGTRDVGVNDNNEFIRTGENNVKADDSGYEGDIEMTSNSEISISDIENSNIKWASARIYPCRSLKHTIKL